jgi:hypothetical protein
MAQGGGIRGRVGGLKGSAATNSVSCQDLIRASIPLRKHAYPGSTLEQRAVCRHTAPRSRCAYPHEFCQNFLPSNVKGAGNAGRLMRPQPRVQSRKHTSSHHGHTGITRHSPRNGFTACFVLSPVTGLFCHRRRRSCLHRLDASVGASGPHDFAVRVSAIRQRRHRVHRIPPRVRDDRERPSVGRDGENYTGDSISEKQKYFLQRGLDTPQFEGEWETK